MNDGIGQGGAVEELTVAVAAVWSDVLQMGDIEAVHEFDGDVQQASRIVMLINQWLGSELTLRQLFQHKTPARLAAFLFERGVRVRDGDDTWPSTSTSDGWAGYWDSTYRFSVPRPDGFNTAGWYDKRGLSRMPDSFMREWVQTTVARLRSLRPRRILEVGCGVGLIMIPMLEHCERYVGTDFSDVAVNRLKGTVGADPRAELHVAEAKEVAGRFRDEYDLVLLNSVVQYFPDLDYLATVVAGLAEQLAPGGSLFLGDLLDRRLHRAMHMSHVVAQLPQNAPVSRALTAVDVSLSGDSSLLLSPDDVLRIAGDLDCRFLVRRGYGPTEMNRFRFDAVLTRHTGTDERPVRETTWPRSGRMDEILSADDEHLVIRSVPDARSHGSVMLAAALEQSPAGTTLAHAADDLPSVAVVEPEAIWEAGHRAGCGVAVAPGREPGYVDVALWRGGEDWDAASLLRR